MTRYSLLLTRERLLEVLSFDKETGRFTWIERGRGRKLGCVAGGLNQLGYRMIGIDGQIYHAHRLVWLLVYGEWPTKDIDHKDLDPDNNCPLNLRLATGAQNQWNTGLRSHNTSGHKGVVWLRDKWMASIQINRKRQYLGVFERFEDACDAYDNVAMAHHGEFAREGC